MKNEKIERKGWEGSLERNLILDIKNIKKGIQDSYVIESKF